MTPEPSMELTLEEHEKERFFAQMALQGLALTYDDVRLQTGYSETMPDDVALETRFSRNIPLRMPIVSAAMDTVTEFPMAIQMAMMGGLGIIHRNLTLEAQAEQVTRVKHHLNGLTGRVDRPIKVTQGMTLREVLNMRDAKKYTFSSFPVVDENDRLVGLITGNHFSFNDDNLDIAVGDVMTRQVITMTPDVGIEQAYGMMKQHMMKVLPLVDEKGMLQGLYTFKDIQRVLTGEARQYNLDDQGLLRVGAAIGTGKNTSEIADRLIGKRVDVLVIDTAHADSAPVYRTLRDLKRMYPLIDVVVGNISHPDSAKRLLDAGADGIKVGQGPGSICTTRIVAGIGSPQVTAVYRCAQALRGSGVPICADGGIRYSGDLPIAIGAGASSVMMGGQLAGTDEAPGETFYAEGQQWKGYRGMGSLGAMESSEAARERYRQGGKSDLIPEGIEGKVEHKGPVGPVLHQFIGGLRRGMGYVGAANIVQLQQKARFDRITEAGKDESHPHNVDITRESPNYNRNRR